MKKLIFIFASVLVFSCTHKSEIKYESGVVVEKQFSPEFSGSGMGVGYDLKSGGTSIHTNNIHKDEQFLLVFKCQHGVVFTIERKDLYATLEKGDTVRIEYKEILDSKDRIKDFDFITATK